MIYSPKTDTTSSRGPLEKTIVTLRRQVWLIVICTVLTGAVAVIASNLQTKQYTSVASLLFRENKMANSVFGSETYTPVGQDAIRAAATNVELVGLQVVSARTATAMDNSTEATDVESAVEVEPQGQSDLVLVKATDPDPEVAQKIANTFAREFIDFRATADRSQLLKAKRLAEREFADLDSNAQNGPRGAQLSSGAERLGILASLQTGNAELVQPAERPEAPSSPKPMRNGVIGAFLGLLLGVGLAFLTERLNRKLRTPEEVGEAFELPVLGEIPESKAISESNDGHGTSPLPFAEEEAFRMVRASLRYFSVDHEIQTLLVTASSAGVGKSTIAWNLARVAAKSSNVVLLESDLRNPSLTRMDTRLAGPGLAEVLTHQVKLEEATQAITLSQASPDNGSTPDRLNVVSAGSAPPNPAELLESQSMADVISQLKESFDFVVIDTPPIAVVSDSFPLIGQVDGVVVVARMKETSRDSASEIRRQLERLNAPVLGVVANAVKSSRSDKYGYGYGYTDSRPRRFGLAKRGTPDTRFGLRTRFRGQPTSS